MAETHELRLKINAGAARAGAAEFRGALKSIQKAVQELDRTTDGAFTSLRTGAKTAAAATANETNRISTASKTAGDRIKQMALASASALRASQNEAQRLAERFNNLGDTAALSRLNAELANLKQNLTNAQSGLDVRVARSGFADTSAELKRYANNLDAAARAERQAADAERSHAASLESLRAKYNPLYLASKQYETALEEISAAEKAGVISAQLAGSARERAAAQLAGASAAADQYGSALRRNAAATQQGIMVGHQLSDVLITAQMGFQSVGMIALQQGSQLASQFNSIRASGGSLFATLLSGFTSLINPLTLITLGAVAAGAAIAKWFFSAGEETKTFNDALNDANTHIAALRTTTDALASNNLSQLRREYGAVNEELRIHLERLQKVAEIDARDVNRGMIDAVRDALTRDGNPLTDSVDEVRRAFDTTNDTARHLLTLMNDIRDAATFEEQAGAVTRLRAEVERVTGGLDSAEGEALEVLLQLVKSEDAAKKLAAAAEGTTTATRQSASAAGSFARELGTAAESARQLLATMGALPGAVAALGRSVDQQISALQAQNESLNLQLSVGLSSEAANRRVQLNDLLKGGAITPDAAAAEFAKIEQLDALAKAQEALRDRLSKTDDTGGGGRIQALGDETGQLQKLIKEMNRRTYALNVENAALKLVVDGQAANIDVAKLMIAAQREGAGAIDAQTQAMIDQYAAAQALNEQLQRLARDPVEEWIKSVPTWQEGARQIEAEVLGSLSTAIANFAQTGKFDFESLANAVLATATRIMAQRAVLELIDLLGGNTGSGGGGSSSGGGGIGASVGGGGGGFFASIFGPDGFLSSFFAEEGGISSAPTSHNVGPVMPATAFRHAPHYKDGTPNTSGIPAILHDNEAVIPLSGNRKVPVELNGGGVGGGTFTYAPNFQINTPDADSFRRSRGQLLADAHTAGTIAARRNK